MPWFIKDDGSKEYTSVSDLYEQELGDKKCPAQPASDDSKSSRPSGAKPKNEPSDSDDLTLRQNNTVSMILQLIRQQQEQINELTKGIEYLAQQVKTLVDALAEDQDPDAPLTTYMDGTPIR